MDRQNRVRPQLVEVLGDTVAPGHLAWAVIISLLCAFGGYFAGLRLFPALVAGALVNSYALLLSMIGCVLGLVANSLLFPPKRVVVEESVSLAERQRLLAELQVDPVEEGRLLAADPATRAELERLNLLALFQPPGGE